MAAWSQSAQDIDAVAQQGQPLAGQPPNGLGDFKFEITNFNPDVSLPTLSLSLSLSPLTSGACWRSWHGGRVSPNPDPALCVPCVWPRSPPRRRKKRKWLSMAGKPLRPRSNSIPSSSAPIPRHAATRPCPRSNPRQAARLRNCHQPRRRKQHLRLLCAFCVNANSSLRKCSPNTKPSRNSTKPTSRRSWKASCSCTAWGFRLRAPGRGPPPRTKRAHTGSHGNPPRAAARSRLQPHRPPREGLTNFSKLELPTAVQDA